VLAEVVGCAGVAVVETRLVLLWVVAEVDRFGVDQPEVPPDFGEERAAEERLVLAVQELDLVA
jgi:hypothetical protein